MKRSEINQVIRDAQACFAKNMWSLQPNPKWDVTDFGLGNFSKNGLVLINLADEEEYCEKLMFAKQNQCTPAHCHKIKKEDIICRKGTLEIKCWQDEILNPGTRMLLKINGVKKEVTAGVPVLLQSGERITLPQGVYHEFQPLSEECIIGEVSTANDDINDNYFVNQNIGRFTNIEEDEPPLVTLVSD